MAEAEAVPSQGLQLEGRGVPLPGLFQVCFAREKTRLGAEIGLEDGP